VVWIDLYLTNLFLVTFVLGTLFPRLVIGFFFLFLFLFLFLFFFSGGFEGHTKKSLGDHCLWNYLFFIVYLREKDPTLFTGPEQLVKSMLDNKDLSWIPQSRCIALDQQKEEDESTKLLSHLDDMNTELKVFFENLDLQP